MALASVGFLALVATQWQGRQTIDAVVVRGATGLSETAVRAVVDSFRMQSVRNVVYADVRRSVEQLPYVRSASVYLTGVCDLAVDVVERTPVAHIVCDDGTLRYVDAEGMILPPAPRRLGFNIPLLRAVGQVAMCDADVRRMAAVVVAAGRTLDPVLFQTVSEVRFDAARGSMDLVADGVTWRMRIDDMHPAEPSFADMNVFWRHAASRLPVGGAEIDLTWRHQVVVRTRSHLTSLTTPPNLTSRLPA